MRYRALDANGDSTFCSGRTSFLVNSAAAVGQLVLTRLRLSTGEWFLDQTEGTPYSTEIVGRNTTATYDAAIQDRVLGTEGVLAITAYSSDLNRATRALAVNMTLSTIFGSVTIQATIQVQPGFAGLVVTPSSGAIITDSSGEIITV